MEFDLFRLFQLLYLRKALYNFEFHLETAEQNEKSTLKRLEGEIESRYSESYTYIYRWMYSQVMELFQKISSFCSNLFNT